MFLVAVLSSLKSFKISKKNGFKLQRDNIPEMSSSKNNINLLQLHKNINLLICRKSINFICFITAYKYNKLLNKNNE